MIHLSRLPNSLSLERNKHFLLNWLHELCFRCGAFFWFSFYWKSSDNQLGVYAYSCRHPVLSWLNNTFLVGTWQMQQLPNSTHTLCILQKTDGFQKCHDLPFLLRTAISSVFNFFFPISSAVRCPLPVEVLAACAPFAGVSSSVENQTNAFLLVVVLAVSFCAFCMVYPINHTSRKIILSWYELNYIYLISQNMPLICISMSILNVAFFFFSGSV